jgi:hypothetical protein
MNNGYTKKFYYSDSSNPVNLGIRIKKIVPITLAVIDGIIITLRFAETSRDLLEYAR